MKNTVAITNNSAVDLGEIPFLPYEEFLEMNTQLVRSEENHCVQYFGYIAEGHIRLICCIANDSRGEILVSSSEIVVSTAAPYPSFTARHLGFHIFERVLHENFGVSYSDHPWLKPVRYPVDRAPQGDIADYPFYQIKSEELHEVGVGPIHAGIIEPGHFRFICKGEEILHLEIQLGYQHRGVEALFLTKKRLLQRALLAESVAGDSVAAHATTFSNLWEALCGFSPDPGTAFDRCIALELEKIAMHTGDLAALCTDIGYQPGGAVFGRLRTPVINFFQEWCGNRLAKGLIRPGEAPYPFTPVLAARLEDIFEQYEGHFNEMWDEFHTRAGVLARLEKTGILSRDQAVSLGTVGMTARASGLHRDIRISHPFGAYLDLRPVTSIKHHGDAYSRAQLRHDEILQSILYLRKIIRHPPEKHGAPRPLMSPLPARLAIALSEGWRGEICHCAITDDQGELVHYRIKDPSVHNWMGVALAVRNCEISDFPLCNKSFNLSYCGHDL